MASGRLRGIFSLPAALSLALTALGCTPLGVYDSLIPHDRGGRRAAAGLPYGPELRQALDVYVPRGDPAGAPVLVFFYGGSWSSGRRQDYAFVGHAFAARGFVTVIPDHRLVPEVRFPEFLSDLALAVRWAREHAAGFGGDPGRIAFLGHSAGAYNAMMLALDRRYLEAAGVEPWRIRAVAALAGPFDFYPFDVPASVEAFGRWPEPRQTQPVAFAGAAAPPVFLATGAEDTTVRPRNSRVLAERLRQAGATAETRIYPGIGHVRILLELSIPFRRGSTVLEDVTVFLNRQLAPRSGSAPAPPQVSGSPEMRQ